MEFLTNKLGVKLKKIPITKRITAWYSFFIIILFIILLTSSVFISKNILQNRAEKKLKKTVESLQNKKGNFEYFDNGVFFLFYDEFGGIKGIKPKDFDANLPVSYSGISKYIRKDGSYLYYDVKLDENGSFLRGILPENIVFHELSKFFLLFLVLSPILIILIIYIGYKIADKSFKPIRNITNTAREIKEKGNLKKRILIGDGKDEVHDLARTFNGMLDTIEESLDREKRLTIDVSHELRTPLSVIMSESEYGKEYIKDEEARELFEIINKQSEKMRALINQIMELDKLERDFKVDDKIDFSQMILNNCQIYESAYKDIKFIIDVEKNLKVSGNKIMLERLFDNLISNAIKFKKTYIEIRLFKEKNRVILEVINDGEKISKEDSKKIFNRFYQVDSSRNKDLKEGYGLGLSIVDKISKLHGGQVSMESDEEKTIFRLSLESKEN